MNSLWASVGISTTVPRERALTGNHFHLPVPFAMHLFRKKRLSSVRWSYNNNPFNGEGGKVEYVWTSEENGQLGVKYSSLAIRQPARLATNLGQFANAGAILGALVAVSVLLLRYQRRRKKVGSIAGI
jgi:hypothetical protein